MSIRENVIIKVIRDVEPGYTAYVAKITASIHSIVNNDLLDSDDPSRDLIIHDLKQQTIDSLVDFMRQEIAEYDADNNSQ